ncbi:MAG: glutathione S-transferase family protein, partial [Hyphomicrobium sp.]|nr:glutathione S-transferase family protein [Hyphomicrobium sp.]
APHVMAWVQRIITPKADGAFEAWPALAPTLMPLLKEEVGTLFLPWSVTNAAAIAAGDKTFDMTLAGTAWSQEPQKYHARSLAEIRRKYAAAKAAPGLEAILRESGCLSWLAA